MANSEQPQAPRTASSLPQPTSTSSEPTQQVHLAGRPDLTTLWADHARFSLSKSRFTGAEISACLSFFHRLEGTEPPIGFESARVMMSPELANRLVEIMCKALNHFPTKESTAEL